MPSLQGSPRRDVRRRLVAAGYASEAVATGAAQTAAGSADRRVGLYAQKALPEHHASAATWIPVRTIPFLAAVVGLLMPSAALTAVAFLDTRVASLLASLGDRWENTAAAVRYLVDLRSPQGCAAAAGLAGFLLAAALATATRNVRRHRLDDHQGRYRAWGWLSLLLAIAGFGFAFPLGPLFSTLLTDATGWNLHTAGQGWWTLLVTATVMPVGLWAVLPLTQRLATGFWLFSALASWLLAEGIRLGLVAGWQPAMEPFATAAAWQAAADALQVFVPALAAVGTLVASRSVIREARGLVKPQMARSTRAVRQMPDANDQAASWMTGEEAHGNTAPANSTPDDTDASEPIGGYAETEATADDWGEAFDEQDGPQDEPSRLHESGDSISSRPTATASPAVDNSGDDVHLSKAERRRLRKLARRNRAA
jgi:hypothetical protein